MHSSTSKPFRKRRKEPRPNKSIPADRADTYCNIVLRSEGCIQLIYNHSILQQNQGWQRIRKAIIESYDLWDRFPVPELLLQIR